MGQGPYPLALLEKTFTLAVCVRDQQTDKTEQLAQQSELKALIESASWEICTELQFVLKKKHPGHLLGKGQIEKIADAITNAEEEIIQRDDLSQALDFVVVDYDLSPTQLFNLEKILKKVVVDRKALILTLFEQRAQTKEARLQVHLARLYYEKPRLKRAWTHLSRQRGGRYGTRGEGETQIEIDARLIDQQIRKLEVQLDLVQKQRKQQRKHGQHLPHIVLVGYTNAGKSALMKALMRQTDVGRVLKNGKNIYVADRLFATLDPKSAKFCLPSGMELIVTDTVGFVRNLPHELIDAFRATLEETVRADLQLIVLDAGDPEWQDKLATVHHVLSELEVDEKAQILLLNKVDLLSTEQRNELQALFPEALLISATRCFGLEALAKRLDDGLKEEGQLYRLEVAHEAGALRAWLYQQKLVAKELDCSEVGQFFSLSLSPGKLQQLRQKFPQSLESLQALS